MVIGTRLSRTALAAVLVGWSFGAAAQVAPGRIQGAAPTAQPGAAPFVAAEEAAPAAVDSSNTDRVFLDTRVADVRVDDVMTVAVMGQSPDSECPSDRYVFERNRAKWLFQTGRLLQAMREGAEVRVSFTCLQGMQSINAIQFLSPPAPQVASRATPRRGAVVRPTRATLAPGAVPLPPASGVPEGSLQERARAIPLP